MALRILAGVTLVISILFMPFWVTLILTFAGMIYFHIFLEAVFSLLLLDLLYGVPEAKFFGIFFISSIIGVTLLAAVEISKKKLKFYA